MKGLVAIAFLGLFMLAGCGGSPVKPDGLRMGKGDERGRVFITSLSSGKTDVQAEVDSAVEYLDATADPAGYFIEVSCESGVRIGAARFALGSRGAAEVGLDEGTYKFEYADPKPDCDAPAPVETTAAAKAYAMAEGSAEAKAYLAGLGKIHPELNHRRTLAWARYTCNDIADGKDAARIERGIRIRYAGGSRPELTDEQASTIRDLVVTNACPDLG